MPFSNFDAQTRKVLYDAFDAAWLGLDPANLTDFAATDSKLARNLLDAAETGERDPEKLRLAALKGI